jgi:ABC-2 type transport system permease protein
LRLWWEIARRGYGRYAAYPGATVAGIWTNTSFGLLQSFILLALYEHRTDVGGWDESQTLTYVWLAQAMIATVYVFGWFEVALRIRSGDVATDLARPLDPLRYWLAFDLGRAAYHFAFRGVPPFVFALFIFDLKLPESATTWLAFSASLTLGIVVSFAYRFLYNLAAFWLLDYRGVMIVALVISLFFSGMILPLAFFPDWLKTVAHALPFWSVIQVPVDVYLGKHQGAALVGVLALQAAWALGLLALGSAVLRAGTRKLVVQGG